MTNMELQGMMLGVISRLVMLLCLLQLVLDFGDELVVVHQLLIHSGHPSHTQRIWRNCWWIPTVDDTERRGLQGALERRVVTEFYPRQPMYPLARVIP
jgi:hypothetical protein